MDPSTTTMSVANLIGVIGEVFEAATGWVLTVAETIGSSPLLLFGVAVPFVGLGVGLFKRLMRV